MTEGAVTSDHGNTWLDRARRAFDRHHGAPIIGSAALALAFVYVIIKGTFARGAKDIDTRYFFVAGKVWLKGLSPYDFSHYRAVWKSCFSEEISQGGFAYLPGSILYSAPLGLFDWPTAAIVFRAMNIAAVGLIILLGIGYVRRHATTPIKLRHYAWIAFGVAMGGVPGTILTGQSSIIVCAATLTLVTLPLRWWPLMLPAMFVASSKPQIAGPILAVVFFADRAARRHLAIAGAGAIVLSAVALWGDHAPVTNLFQAIRGNAGLGANDPTRMIGLGPLLRFLPIGDGPIRILGWLALVAVIVVVARHSSEGATPERRLAPTALMAGFVSVGLAYPYHGYDTAIFAPTCAMAGILSGRRQLLCLPVFAVMGRPRLLTWPLGSAAASEATQNTIVGLFWLVALAAFICWVVRDARRPRRALSRSTSAARGPGRRHLDERDVARPE